MLCIATETPDQCSTPLEVHATLYQNIFQGEPAISGFDWHITSYHNSSELLAANNGADLPLPFGRVHPGHGKLTRFRVIHALHNRPIQARFHYGSSRHGINLQRANTRRLILQ